LKIKVVGINARFTHSCLALFYLRNELQQNLEDVEVEICQYTINDPYYDTVQKLLDDHADYIFFSTLIWNSDFIEQLITDLLIIDRACRIVIGGPQARVSGARFTSSSRVCVFNGNIEAASPIFYNDLQSMNLQKIYEASFWETKGIELHSPYRPEDFGGPLKNRYVYYESSRGCPFSCTYCLSSAEKGLYHRKLEDVFNDLDEIFKHSPKSVRFVDRTFNDKPDRALALWNYLAVKESATLFHFEIAPDRFNDDMFVFLETVRPGLFQFEIGIQSTHTPTLEAIRRPIDPEQAGQLVKRLRRTENIHLHVDLILGLPFDTPESFAVSVNDVFAMRPHYIQMGLLKLLPATNIAESSVMYGYQASKKTPYSVFANKWMTVAELREFFWLGECVERCYNNRYFVSLWDHLVGGGEDMAAFFLALSERFHDQGYFDKATTQETLGRLLLEELQIRSDFELARELICYDWLRCGHRFLPDYLLDPNCSLNELRRSLFNKLPTEIPGLYDKKERGQFFKKGLFYRFTGSTLTQLGHTLQSDYGVICFSPEREHTVHRFNKTRIVEINN